MKVITDAMSRATVLFVCKGRIKITKENINDKEKSRPL